jgi:hypothetical protein
LGIRGRKRQIGVILGKVREIDFNKNKLRNLLVQLGGNGDKSKGEIILNYLIKRQINFASGNVSWRNSIKQMA